MDTKVNNCKVPLQDISTKVLLNYLEHARACGGDGYNIGDNHEPSMFISIAEIKQELVTREHVPNKQEAKVIRQTKAKNG